MHSAFSSACRSKLPAFFSPLFCCRCYFYKAAMLGGCDGVGNPSFPLKRTKGASRSNKAVLFRDAGAMCVSSLFFCALLLLPFASPPTLRYFFSSQLPTAAPVQCRSVSSYLLHILR